MKKLSILTLSLVALSMSFVSCSKDDNNGSTTSGNLVGKWEYSKEGAVQNGQEYLVAYMGNETGCSKDYIDVTATSVADVDYDSTDNPCEMFTDTYSYTRTGNTITMTVSGMEVISTIVTLTSTELKIKDADGYLTVYTRK